MLPPFRGGPGWGFGKQLVACSPWPVETRFYAVSYIPPPTSYNLFITYHVLRTTYYLQFTYPTSHIPPNPGGVWCRKLQLAGQRRVGQGG